MPQRYSKTYDNFASIYKCTYKKGETVVPIASLLSTWYFQKLFSDTNTSNGGDRKHGDAFTFCFSR